MSVPIGTVEAVLALLAELYQQEYIPYAALHQALIKTHDAISIHYAFAYALGSGYLIEQSGARDGVKELRYTLPKKGRDFFERTTLSLMQAVSEQQSNAG